MLNLREIEPAEAGELYSHMERDFPRNERPPFIAVKRNIEKNVYDAFFLNDGRNDIGYAIVTAPAENDFALLTFFAVFPERRCAGVGGSFLEILCGRYAERVMILEVEDPAAAVSPEAKRTSLRRIGFYERNGFRLLLNVRLKLFGVEMLLMVNTDDDPGSASEIITSLYLPTFPSRKWLKHIEVTE